ncbi:MAG: hypothetical protein QNJ72_29075 [Pleurocapsa sp. MO_226.B13]|nr:hypothetical protein [Pleurocapsa sp. MO_226.B13]
MTFLLVMKIVDKVIYPIVTQTRSVAGFYIGAIARQRDSYGLVTDIDPGSYRSVTVDWDKNEPFAYTEDELRVLKIEVVEQLLPSKTIVSMPPATTVLLTDGEQVKFKPQELFLVKEVSDRTLIIENATTKETYQFELNSFPGNIFAHKIELPEATVIPVEELPLSLQELQIKAELWLALNFNPILLTSLTPAIEQRLKEQYSQSLQQSFISSDLDLAWSVAFEQYLKEQARKIGLFGLKIATKMLWYAEERSLFGQITNIDYRQQSFSLQWDNVKQSCLTIFEMKALAISAVSFVRLSDNVAYEVSSDCSYLNAYIGFRTKKLAKAWLRRIKKIVGRLSNLKDYRVTKSDSQLETKWEYRVEQFRCKSMKKRLQSLEIVSQLNLDKMPPK